MRINKVFQVLVVLPLHDRTWVHLFFARPQASQRISDARHLVWLPRTNSYPDQVG